MVMHSVACATQRDSYYVHHVSETCPIAHQNLLSFIYKLIILLQFEPSSSQDLRRVR